MRPLKTPPPEEAARRSPCGLPVAPAAERRYRWANLRSSEIKRAIQRSAEEIVRLHKRMHETARQRGAGREGRELWEQACAEFHARFDGLSFPGGYETAGSRILAGDTDAVEAAICFLELRPYFFRSGYMYRSLLRKTKRASLSQGQSERLQVVLERLGAWQATKRSGSVA